MLGLKCIGGALIGGIIGAIIAVILGIVLAFVGWIIGGNQTANNLSNLAMIALPAGIIIGIFLPIQADSAANAKAQEAERKRLAEEAARLEEECKSLALMRDSSHSKFYSLENLVNSAGGWLDAAEKEFKEGAFAPFWDALEHATNFLGAYHQSIGEIKTSASNYETRRARLSVSVPVFDVPEAGMPDARPLASRLSSLGRAAQKDFQFATIYEQRKTNQLLYSGFGTLAAGLERMQYAITDALDDLSLSLGTRLDDLLAVSTSHAEAFNNYSQAAASHFEASASHYKESDDESKKQSEMLDNIQRGHKPPQGALDRVFHTRAEGDTTKPHDVSADD
jgi:hypothetical protein